MCRSNNLIGNFPVQAETSSEERPFSRAAKTILNTTIHHTDYLKKINFYILAKKILPNPTIQTPSIDTLSIRI